MSNTLYIGIGNPGRCDDGIGWAVLDALRKLQIEGTFEYRYQLNVEDAELISHYEEVLLIDASEADLASGYRFTRVEAQADFTFSTHELSPSAVVQLCRDLFARSPNVHLLEIRAYNWEIGEGISPKAQAHISRAVAELEEVPAGTINKMST